MAELIGEGIGKNGVEVDVRDVKDVAGGNETTILDILHALKNTA